MQRLTVILGVFFIALTAVFFWERDFAVDSYRVHTQMTG